MQTTMKKAKKMKCRGYNALSFMLDLLVTKNWLRTIT